MSSAEETELAPLFGVTAAHRRADAAVIAGTATTPFGRRPERSLVELACDAARAALAEAGIGARDLDAIYVGTFLSQALGGQGVLASLVAERLGAGPLPTTVVEGACASGAIALRHGALACRAGAADAVLCLGVERMTAVPTAVATAALAQAFDAPERELGLTFPGFFALVASAHAARWGTTAEQMAAVAVKNRGFGTGNPSAMFREAVAAEDVLSARLICDPLRLLDCSPIADGAAAAVVTRPSAATAARGRPIHLLACEQASGPAGVAAIDDLTSFPATVAAAARAYAAAGVTADEIDVVELHDCFTIAEIVDCEDLGLLPRGEAGAAVVAGATGAGGDAATVNPSGGLLSRGHPVGATGLAQVHELVAQLRDEAVNQVPAARIGLAHNLGGTGATATVTILAT